ncbi:hypothetical protein Baya_10733 [Bagarius yarrelli]|uniref:Uncharacterized protein n=1 Tax=Bagarius yarrelli TaxID=175774 RepID=A0A556UGA7_BAGYA|nr:hypothetical protein Baya_10733 [Bagarius yarrelli]
MNQCKKPLEDHNRNISQPVRCLFRQNNLCHKREVGSPFTLGPAEKNPTSPTPSKESTQCSMWQKDQSKPVQIETAAMSMHEPTLKTSDKAFLGSSILLALGFSPKPQPCHALSHALGEGSKMDESTFETFDEELGDVPQPKPLRQSRRPVPLRKSLSIQNVAQIEAPWEGVTLNRCLFIVITILVLTSGCQRLHEFLRGRKEGSDFESMGTALNVRHTAVKKYHVRTPEPETSLWDTFLWWVSEDEDDDDDDDEDDSGRGRSNKMKATGGLRHKAITDRSLLKGGEGRFKARRNKARQDEEESQENVTRLRTKKLEKEEEEREEQEDKAKQVTSKKSKKKTT